MRILVFISQPSKAIYLWNGTDVVCIKGSEVVHLNTPVSFFKKIDFRLLHKNATRERIKNGFGFKLGNDSYKILHKSKLNNTHWFKLETLIDV